MIADKITPSTQNILRFYAKCFIYPYEEMQYELQHLFRLIERDTEYSEEFSHIDQILNIVNMYQGMEIREIREEYVSLFSGEARCPLFARNFSNTYNISYDSDSFSDLIIDCDIPVNPDEPADSIINYLEYLSLLLEEYTPAERSDESIMSFIRKHIIPWIFPFCDVLYKTSDLSFYRETAVGLHDYLSWLLD